MIHNDWSRAVYGLIGRVLPEKEAQFVLDELEDEIGRDIFSLDFRDGKIVIGANRANSAALALGYYVRHSLGWDMSWCGGRTPLPETLPAPKPVRRVVEQKWRSYMNFCTFNYSASWWDFDRWEKELDFMAMQGVNLPLSIVGVEAVWYETLLKFGFKDEEAREFLAGPAFLAWQWMTNLEGFCGPLPLDWIRRRQALGKQMIGRMCELGMTPVQMGFSGFVPQRMKEKRPAARIAINGDWCGLPGTAQLDPLDPLFDEFGSAFLQTQKELFGAFGFYSADPFHEVKPPEETAEYLGAVGQAVHGLIKRFDPAGVWVMQSWSIRKEIACEAPKSDLLVFDLAGAGHIKHDGFWGYPFVTGSLHNFGGRTNLHGDLKRLADNPFEAVRGRHPNVCGTGLFMEGINQNPVYYSMAFEMLTAAGRQNLDQWLAGYVQRRYGTDDERARRAWDILRRTVYAPGTDGVEKSSIVCARPAVDVKKSGPNDGFLIPYGNKRLLEAAQLLSELSADSEGFRYDAVDLTRQVMSNFGQKLYREVSEHFKNREREAFLDSASRFLELLSDLDRLLSTRPEFCLENWIADARKWGEKEEEKAYYEYNACVLITLWGTEQGAKIFDYAWKEWAGLIGSYYLPRWKQFFDMLDGVLERGGEYQEEGLPLEHGREAFRASSFYERLADWEGAWLHSEKTFEQSGCDALEEARAMLAKYGPEIMA